MTEKPVVKIEVLEYNPQWPHIFQELRGILAGTLGELALRIEHVGSTSVPGLPAKPIIDMVVEISSRDLLPEVIERLRTLGYRHEGDLGVTEREAFKREDTTVPRDGSGCEWMTQHLYVCATGNRAFVEQLAFRDYLRAHPETAEEYQNLKRELATRFAWDRVAYTEAKTEFIMGVVQRALGESRG